MIKISVIFLIVVLLSACSIAPKTNSAVAIYDFGVQYEQPSTVIKNLPRAKTKSLLITDIESAPGFDDHAIYYRLSYNNPTRSYTYANSRWAATPAILLSQQLRNKIVTKTNDLVIKDSGTAKSDYALHIELEEFTQVFDTIDSSHAVISIRASLVERQSHTLLAQQSFGIIQNAVTADAPGAVHALSTASDLLINAIIDWLTTALHA